MRPPLSPGAFERYVLTFGVLLADERNAFDGSAYAQALAALLAVSTASVHITLPTPQPVSGLRVIATIDFLTAADAEAAEILLAGLSLPSLSSLLGVTVVRVVGRTVRITVRNAPSPPLPVSPPQPPSPPPASPAPSVTIRFSAPGHVADHIQAAVWALQTVFAQAFGVPSSWLEITLAEDTVTVAKVTTGQKLFVMVLEIAPAHSSIALFVRIRNMLGDEQRLANLLAAAVPGAVLVTSSVAPAPPPMPIVPSGLGLPPATPTPRCKVCPVGFKCPEGSLQPVPCEEGTKQPRQGAAECVKVSLVGASNTSSGSSGGDDFEISSAITSADQAFVQSWLPLLLAVPAIVMVLCCVIVCALCVRRERLKLRRESLESIGAVDVEVPSGIPRTVLVSGKAPAANAGKVESSRLAPRLTLANTLEKAGTDSSKRGAPRLDFSGGNGAHRGWGKAKAPSPPLSPARRQVVTAGCMHLDSATKERLESVLVQRAGEEHTPGDVDFRSAQRSKPRFELRKDKPSATTVLEKDYLKASRRHARQAGSMPTKHPDLLPKRVLHEVTTPADTDDSENSSEGLHDRKASLGGTMPVGHQAELNTTLSAGALVMLSHAANVQRRPSLRTDNDNAESGSRAPRLTSDSRRSSSDGFGDRMVALGLDNPRARADSSSRTVELPSHRALRSDSDGALPVGDEADLNQTLPAGALAVMAASSAHEGDVQQQRKPSLSSLQDLRISNELRRNSAKGLDNRMAYLGLAEARGFPRGDSLSRTVELPSRRASRSDSDGALPAADEAELSTTLPIGALALLAGSSAHEDHGKQQRRPSLSSVQDLRISNELLRNSDRGGGFEIANQRRCPSAEMLVLQSLTAQQGRQGRSKSTSSLMAAPPARVQRLDSAPLDPGRSIPADLLQLLRGLNLQNHEAAALEKAGVWCKAHVLESAKDLQGNQETIDDFAQSLGLPKIPEKKLRARLASGGPAGSNATP